MLYGSEIPIVRRLNNHNHNHNMIGDVGDYDNGDEGKDDNFSEHTLVRLLLRLGSHEVENPNKSMMRQTTTTTTTTGGNAGSSGKRDLQEQENNSTLTVTFRQTVFEVSEIMHL
jgi:hypothetical protein